MIGTVETKRAEILFIDVRVGLESERERREESKDKTDGNVMIRVAYLV